jgi:hypothetical protein
LHFLRRIIFENVCSIMYIELGKLLKKDWTCGSEFR